MANKKNPFAGGAVGLDRAGGRHTIAVTGAKAQRSQQGKRTDTRKNPAYYGRQAAQCKAA